MTGGEDLFATLQLFLGVALGGGVGSVLRLGLARLKTKSLPVGVLLANTLGAALLTHFAALNQDWLWAALTAGLSGGLSTFSTWAGQTGEMWRAGRRADAVNNALLNALLPIFAVLLVIFGQWLAG